MLDLGNLKAVLCVNKMELVGDSASACIRKVDWKIREKLSEFLKPHLMT